MGGEKMGNISKDLPTRSGVYLFFYPCMSEYCYYSKGGNTEC